MQNAPLTGAQSVIQAYAKQIYDSIQRDGFYVRVPAGKQFYLYVTQTIDESDAVIGGTRLTPNDFANRNESTHRFIAALFSARCGRISKRSHAMKRMLFFIPLILLSACASNKPVVVQMPRSVPGTTLATDDMESVRYGENLKAYSFGRYVDPNDGLVMHEAHTVYRVETTAKWNLHPNAPVTVPGGPVVGIIDPAHKDSPLTPEVVAEVDRQKAATMALIVQGQRMNQALNQLSKTLSVTAQVAVENAQLKSEVTTTEKRLDALEEEFRKTQTEAPFTTPATPSVKGTNDW